MRKLIPLFLIVISGLTLADRAFAGDDWRATIIFSGGDRKFNNLISEHSYRKQNRGHTHQSRHKHTRSCTHADARRPGYSSRRIDSAYRGQGYSRGYFPGGDWIRAQQFQTRTRHRSDPVIEINARITAIGLTGRKRDAAIYEAYAELGDGKLVPLRALEGRLYSGNSHVRHFERSRYVKRLILRVGPEQRYRRAYVAVDYLPASGKRSDRNRRHH